MEKTDHLPTKNWYNPTFWGKSKPIKDTKQPTEYQKEKQQTPKKRKKPKNKTIT